jgi:hypothetical protein
VSSLHDPHRLLDIEQAHSGTVTYNGREYPTYGHGVSNLSTPSYAPLIDSYSQIWVIHHSMQRRPDLFPEPDSFLPHRFLNESNIPKDAFRPFEKGPRSCIGQELATIELRIILLLTVRDFDFKICYDDVSTATRQGRYANVKGASAPQELGGRAYQMLKFGPKPNEGMPVRVAVRNEKA